MSVLQKSYASILFCLLVAGSASADSQLMVPNFLSNTVRDELNLIAQRGSYEICRDQCIKMSLLLSAAVPRERGRPQVCYQNPVTDLVYFPGGRARGFFLQTELKVSSPPDARVGEAYNQYRLFVVTNPDVLNDVRGSEIFEGEACYNNDGKIKARDSSLQLYGPMPGPMILPQSAHDFLGSPLDDYRRVRIASVPEGAPIFLRGRNSGAVTSKVLRMREDQIMEASVKIGGKVVPLSDCPKVRANIMPDVDLEFRCQIGFNKGQRN